MAWPPKFDTPYDKKMFETTLWLKEALIKKTRNAIRKNMVVLKDVPNILNKLEPKRQDIRIIVYLKAKKRFPEAMQYIKKILSSLQLEEELVDTYSKFFPPGSEERVDDTMNAFNNLREVIYSCWEDPTVGLLEAQLEKEIAKENYENAGKLKEQIRKLTIFEGPDL